MSFTREVHQTSHIPLKKHFLFFRINKLHIKRALYPNLSWPQLNTWINILYFYVFLLMIDGMDHRSSSSHSSFWGCCCFATSLCWPLRFSFKLISTFCGYSGCWLMFWMSSFSYSPFASFYSYTLLNSLAYYSKSSPISLHKSTRKRRHSMLSGYSW